MKNARIAFIALSLFAVGCGGSGTKKDKDFFTSGSHEADQRAEQRVARDAQIQGKGERGGQDAGADVKKPLYDRLGGQPGVQAIVDDFITRAMADPRVNWTRKGVRSGVLQRSAEWQADPNSVKLMKAHISQFIAVASGGPANYSGKEMKAAHAGMKITNAEFDASVGDLKATLDNQKIPTPEQKELLAIIETTRPQVVEER